LTRVVENLNLCLPAIHVERKVSEHLISVLHIHSPIYRLEKTLLSLACSETADAIFYSAFLKVGQHIQFRYFEHGEYVGFSRILRRAGNDQVLPWQIYTPCDVQRNCKEVNMDSSYIRKLTKIKAVDVESVNNVPGVQCTFLMISVLKKPTATVAPSSHPYFYCSDSYIASENWKQLLHSFRTLKPQFDTSLDKRLCGPLSLPEQFEYISLIPNLHTWKWKDEGGAGKHGIRQGQMFSTSFKDRPTSPRNRILHAYMEYPIDCSKLICAIIRNLCFGHDLCIKPLYPRRKKMQQTYVNE